MYTVIKYTQVISHDELKVYISILPLQFNRTERRGNVRTKDDNNFKKTRSIAGE